jgi:formylglycine-generating enzyme required for sulfatase activity
MRSKRLLFVVVPIVYASGCFAVTNLDRFYYEPTDTAADGGADGQTLADHDVADAADEDARADSATCTGGDCSVPASCRANGTTPLPAGAGHDCGLNGKGDCCGTIALDGGDFYPNNCTKDVPCGPDGGPGPDKKTHVQPFKLDVYEVTVGRFSRFIEAGAGTQAHPPAAGAGAIHGHAFTGWNPMWNQHLLVQGDDINGELSMCSRLSAPGTYELGPRLPITCVNWYEALAFCIWDGGRLPTEVEWSFAATGGDEQRPYPWGDAGPYDDAGSPTFANLCPGGEGVINDDASAPGLSNFVCFAGVATDVGSYPLGRFGHADLAGGALELVYDVYNEAVPFPCDGDCVASVEGENPTRVVHGSSYEFSEYLARNSSRDQVLAYRRLEGTHSVGFRCAREP